jgi:hypothetical protein
LYFYRHFIIVMALDSTTKTCLIIGGIIVIAVIVYFVWKKKNGKKEGYSNIGDLDNVGSLDSSYSLVQSPEDVVPAVHFADLVDGGDHHNIVRQPENTMEDIRPMERLERITSRNLLPRTAASVTPYNVDVAQPSAWAFSLNAPRVQLKNRLYQQADPYRGDIAISYHPNIALIGKSEYGRDSQRLDGTFSSHFTSLYNKLTNRAYKNLPLMTSVGGTVMDAMP